jgi:hypothetical protein
LLPLGEMIEPSCAVRAAAPDVDVIRIAAESPQLRVNNGHAYQGDPTLADAILDRLVHPAHRFGLKGKSLRKVRTAPAAAG